MHPKTSQKGSSKTSVTTSMGSSSTTGTFIKSRDIIPSSEARKSMLIKPSSRISILLSPHASFPSNTPAKISASEVKSSYNSIPQDTENLSLSHHNVSISQPKTPTILGGGGRKMKRKKGQTPMSMATNVDVDRQSDIGYNAAVDRIADKENHNSPMFVITKPFSLSSMPAMDKVEDVDDFLNNNLIDVDSVVGDVLELLKQSNEEDNEPSEIILLDEQIRDVMSQTNTVVPERYRVFFDSFNFYSAL